MSDLCQDPVQKAVPRKSRGMKTCLNATLAEIYESVSHGVKFYSRIVVYNSAPLNMRHVFIRDMHVQ